MDARQARRRAIPDSMSSTATHHCITPFGHRHEALVPEVPFPRKHHRHPPPVRGRDDLVVAHRAARLDDGRHARLRRSLHAVRQRGRRHRRPAPPRAPGRRPAAPPGAPNRPGSSAPRPRRRSRCPAPARSHSTSYASRRSMQTPERDRSAVVGSRFVTTCHVDSSTPRSSGVCASSPPLTERRASPEFRPLSRPAVRLQHPAVLLVLGQPRQRLFAVIWRDQHLDKQPAHRLDERQVDRPVAGDDAAECRDGVAFVRQPVRLDGRGGDWPGRSGWCA